MNHLWLSRALVACALFGAVRPVAAQPAGAQAETLYNEARALLEQGKVAEACATFESSQKAEASVTTLYSLATCRMTNRQIATAWGLFVDVERATRDATDATAQQLGQLAVANAAKLEPRLSKLSITVAPEHQLAGLAIHRGDDVVDAGAWNHALPIDGGTYRITASAPGHAAWSSTITVTDEGDTQTVAIPALAVEVAPPPPPPIREHMAGPLASRTLPIALGAGAVVLGASAVAFELWGEHYNNEIAGSTDNGTRLALWHSANARRYAAEATGVAALGCAGAAIYLLVRDREAPSHMARGVELVPLASPQSAGLALDGRW